MKINMKINIIIKYTTYLIFHVFFFFFLEQFFKKKLSIIILIESYSFNIYKY